MTNDILKISQADRTPLVEALLLKLDQAHELIESLHETVQAQKEEIRVLKDEIAILKKSSKRPKLPKSKNKKKKSKSQENNESKKRPGSEKRSKKSALKIDDIKVISPENLPPGSRLKRRRNMIIQDLLVKTVNTKYILEEWETPEGKVVSAQLPKGISKGHFGNDLVRFIIYQYHHCQVTQPLIKEQLLELGVDISVGQINRLLTENLDEFHREKEEILRKGLEISKWVQTDDTGARHQGKTGYCTHIGNMLFAWFGSSATKSRINFLKILNNSFGGGYKIDDLALRYMKQEKLPREPYTRLKRSIPRHFDSEESWSRLLRKHGIKKPKHIRVATEAALLAGAVDKGLNKDLIILSDDAGQFNIPMLLHALCWIHEIRHIKNLIPTTNKSRKAQSEVLDEVFQFYESLKEYRSDPTKIKREKIETEFNRIFTQKTSFVCMNLALCRIHKKKNELLLFLDHPSVPVHNNDSEGDIREFVKRRKVSGGTRSASGRLSRDTFASLKKTCRKLAVSFWQYLEDRLAGENNIPYLPDLMVKKAAENSNPKQLIAV